MTPNMEHQIVSHMTAGDLVELNKRAEEEERKALENKKFYAFVRESDIIPNRLRIGNNGELQIGDKNGNWRVELSAREIAILRRSFPGFKKLFVVTDRVSAKKVSDEVNNEKA